MGELPIENTDEIAKLEKLMEEFASGKPIPYEGRQPGERCMYEIQRRDNYEKRNTIIS